MSRTAAREKGSSVREGSENVSMTAGGMQDSRVRAGQQQVSRTAAREHDGSVREGSENVSMTAGGMQDSSMSKAAPHELDWSKGQTAVNK